MSKPVLLACIVLLIAGGEARPGPDSSCCDPAGRFLFMELKDPTRKLFGINGISVDFDDRIITINDWGQSFESCKESGNDVLRLLCKTITEAENLSRVDPRDSFGNIDVCQTFLIADLLKDGSETVSARDDDPSGFVACQNDSTKPDVKLSMVIFGNDEIGAIYIDFLDPGNGKVLQEQVFIAQGERMIVKIPVSEWGEDL